MWTALFLLALAVAASPEGGSPSGRPVAVASAPTNVIRMHVGVPGLVYLGQPLSEFLGKFPAAQSTPVVGQIEVVRLQVAAEGISCLAMGKTPATMTLGSIGFNFGAPYEGVSPGKRRTVEGIGSGSTVNDLLGTYGRPAESSDNRTKGTPSLRRQPAEDPAAPVQHLYRSGDGSVTTYFVVVGHEVMRMAIGRPEMIEKHYSTTPAGARTGEP